MTLQQLRYLIAIAEYGSINAAAHNLYASQSNLSTAVRELERELGITIFARSNRGVTLTNEGAELVGYARQVVEQADMLEARYIHGEQSRQRLAVSTQHYAFSVEAFIATASECTSEEYDFVLREVSTGQIIDDVRAFRSEIGILYLDSFNERVLGKAFDDAGVEFSALFEAPVHVFVGEGHPLAGHEVITLDELQDFPRYSFEQGTQSTFFFSEEPLSALPHKRTIRFTDRGTLSNLLSSYDGYTLSTGVLSSEMHTGIVSIPLEGDALMRVGYIIHAERRPSELLTRYIEHLKRIIESTEGVRCLIGC